MIKQITIKPILIFTTLLILTGCWDQEEIDQRAYVLGIGLDKTSHKGIIKVTYLISNPEAGSTQVGGGSQEPTHETITFNAPDFIRSQNIANAVIAKTITYDILDFFVVSEDFAKDKDFIRWIYDATKDRDIRRDTRLIITKETANKFIENNKPKLETRRHEYFEIMFKDSIKIGLIPDSTIHNFFRITEADADLFITAYATTEQDEDTAELNSDPELIAGKLKVTGNTNPAQFLGSAIFKEGRMIGTLSVEETRIAELMNTAMEMPSFLASFPDPFMEGYWITARYTQINDPEIKVDVTQKTPKIRVNLPLLVEVLTDHSMVNYANNKDKRDELKEHMKKRIQERIAALVKRTQEEFLGQPFGFSLAARKHFLTIPQWEKYDWMKSYPDAVIEISVDITYGEFGRQSELPSYQRVRD
ncbi:Spore germination B3/ GerAC like, C-terminal [Schinkia azotoformans MEV2011]|uniref:Spore germination B3/ GerAC like, C-terminal n=1 Tax=Schinkia azotoformans MEV2011 TaxID=1348973 RepID=A0A072NPR6_SCHAZ|nr:Ger(x)C family spore germination C-terminal domain-containing protein [Schinkia azotoformans]KEF39242.1 Spore germination B3/ GerAC like, C-terminal [Schinkia azotoformans MEV2011]MEC1695907.1 Ger(x)C family spore germination C-terminal domain-containing protein [Schinkia azotoformans]MEC1726063.1 Ger(x)C family spore germination C-terminal domain-containing protein [Schinkia azotoformans]MEC1772084.1 Ger(x)C family spore germination C-terminal domain-containing protein [Schinkia azotoforman